MAQLYYIIIIIIIIIIFKFSVMADITKPHIEAFMG